MPLINTVFPKPNKNFLFLYKEFRKIARFIEKDPNYQNYIIAFLFYRYLSEDITDAINQKVRNYFSSNKFQYSKISDGSALRLPVKKDIIKEKGCFLLPSQLFINVYCRSFEDTIFIEHLDRYLVELFHRIENSSFYATKNFSIFLSEINSPHGLAGLGESYFYRIKNIKRMLKLVNDIQIYDYYKSKLQVSQPLSV